MGNAECGMEARAALPSANSEDSIMFGLPFRTPDSAFRTGLSRSDFVKLSAAGVLGTSMSGWLPVLAARGAEAKLKTKSCILLWMDGGPRHKDTLDLNPSTTGAGELNPIPTSVPGIQISGPLP